MRTTIRMAVAALALAPATAPAPAFAHGDDKPRHGGQVAEVGETVFELVRAPAGVSLYIREDGDDVPAAGMTAKLVVTVAGGKRSEVPLTAAGGNRFVAAGAKLPPGAKVGVLVVDKQTQARQSASFTIK